MARIVAINDPSETTACYCDSCGAKGMSVYIRFNEVSEWGYVDFCPFCLDEAYRKLRATGWYW